MSKVDVPVIDGIGKGSQLERYIVWQRHGIISSHTFIGKSVFLVDGEN
jgi:hypothetical protein